MTVRGHDLPPLEFDQLKSLEFLDRCLKETLRLRPPIMTMMRMVKIPQVLYNYTDAWLMYVCVIQVWGVYIYTTLCVVPCSLLWILTYVYIIQVVGGYTVPVGHQLCVSPTVNSRLEDVWDNPQLFDPDRYAHMSRVPPPPQQFAPTINQMLCNDLLTLTGSLHVCTSPHTHTHKK